MIRTFIYVSDNLKLFYRASIFWFVIIIYEALTGFSILNLEDTNSFLFLISFIITLSATSSISVFVFRYVLLEENKDNINVFFGKRESLYLILSSILTILFFVPVFIFFIRVYYAYQNNSGSVFEFSLILLFMLLFYISYARINLIFPLLAIDKKISIKDIFILTHGSSFKIFGAFFIIISIVAIIYYGILSIIAALGLWSWLTNLLNVTLLLFISYIDVFIRSILLAHIYRYLTFHKIKDENIKE